MASIKLKGDTSGEITIQAPAVAGTTTLNLPATSSTLATQNALGVRNLIINGDMRIAQRGTTFTSQTSSAYHLDRWKLNAFNISSGVYQINQDTDAPSGFSNSLKLSCTTANGTQDANNIIYIEQQIEGLNTSHLKYFVTSPDTVTLSFWIKTNLSGTYSVTLKLSDNGSIQNNTATRVYNTTYTVNSANTWERKTVTIQLDSAVGDIQVIDNRFAVATTFWFGAGTSRDGATTNTWVNNGNTAAPSDNLNILGNTSNYINITGVQLEISDGEATPFEHRPYDMELARCQRYFEKSYNYDTAVGSNTALGNVVAGGSQITNTTSFLSGNTQSFRVTKRANPTVTLWDRSGTINKITRFTLGQSTNHGNTPNVVDMNERGFYVYTNSGETNNSGVIYHWRAEAEL